MSHRKFSVVLEEYLTERDRQNGDYYEHRYFGDRTEGQWRMDDLTAELDKMVQGAMAAEIEEVAE